ncbi:site-specific DNA-methyltransferase [Cetobacterium somerae]|uniref:site-specific DNA-methyltransferase n=1 Tax=Cetobacterium somerae TaxID=188913 RepID=UPI00211DCD52|nr:site-specific DNA-methyltransferase [Cetobacterium somerae]MCQ9627536.1 site-specific DNA-methyltransferase [Cetobacterium somerae]
MNELRLKDYEKYRHDIHTNHKKEYTTPVILFAAEPYSSNLIRSNQKQYKYKKYWKKDRPSNFLNAKKQPLRDIEEICIFYKKQCTYNPKMTEGKPCNDVGKQAGKKINKNRNYGNFKLINREDSAKYPRQMLSYSRPHPPEHRTEKPVPLMEDLVETYTNEGDLILDFTMGTGATGIACKKLNRKFIGIEKVEKYFNIARERIEKE